MIDRRLKEFSLIDQCLMKLMFDEVKDRFTDNRWHTWDGYLKYQGKIFKASCEFRCNGKAFSMRNHKVEIVSKVM